MRLSTTAWLILGSGVFIIVFAALFMLYSGQASDEEQMETSLADAQVLLPQLISQNEDLQSQLTQLESQMAQAESAFDESMAKFPEEVESIEYDETLFMIAYDCDLKIVKLVATEPADQEVEDVTYIVTSFNIDVSPTAEEYPKAPDAYEAYVDTTVANILDFVNNVVYGEYFTTATVDSITIKIHPFEEITGSERPSATIILTIYSYEGE